MCACDTLLSNIELPRDAAAYCDINCKNPQHGLELCSLYDNIMKSLLVSSRLLYKDMYKAGPDWNDYVERGLEGLSRYVLRQVNLNMIPYLNIRKRQMKTTIFY